MLEIKIDTRRLNAAMQRMAEATKKDLAAVVRQQSGIIVGHLIALTPPGAARGQSMTDTGGIDNAAKKHGEASIAADIAVLFPTTKLASKKIEAMMEAGFQFGTGRGRKIVRDFAESESDLARIHSASRSANGRVRTGSTGQNMALTRSAIRRAYIKKQQQKVGLLNAGWLPAANELKTAARATPAWIRRHGSKAGGVSFVKTTQGLTITVSNRQNYFPKNMDARIQRAVFRRGDGLRKALFEMTERNARKANSAMGS